MPLGRSWDAGGACKVAVLRDEASKIMAGQCG